VLRVVAWIFIVWGLLSVGDMIYGLPSGSLNLSAGVIGIFLGRGLLRLGPGSRKCAIVLLWVGALWAILQTAVPLITGRPCTIHFAGRVWEPRPDWAWVGPASFTLCMWQLSVLRRPVIRALFATKPACPFNVLPPLERDS
jgi:hypothetical protein